MSGLALSSYTCTLLELGSARMYGQPLTKYWQSCNLEIDILIAKMKPSENLPVYNMPKMTDYSGITLVTLLQYFVSILHDSCIKCGTGMGQQRNAGGGTESGTGRPQQEEEQKE